jgi:hypothetical protein
MTNYRLCFSTEQMQALVPFSFYTLSRGRYKYRSGVPKHEKTPMPRLSVTSLEVQSQSLKASQVLTSVFFHSRARQILPTCAAV